MEKSKEQKITENFSECFKNFRKKTNLTQGELACKLGISRQSVNAIEKGKSLPSIDLALDIAQFFDTSLDNFFHIEKIMNEIENKIEREVTMPELSPWKPFREMVSLRDAMDRLLEDSFIPTTETKLPAVKGLMPLANMYETEKDIVAEIQAPGYKEEEISVEVDDEAIYIKGEKKAKQEEKDGNYFYREISYGSFSRTMPFPVKVRSEKSNAIFEDGILKITVPKIVEKKAKATKLKISRKK